MSSSIETFVARAVLLLALVTGAAFAVSAQVTTGSLQGVVTDPNQAAVVVATVRVTNVETTQARETTTNEQGFYRFTNLLPGQRYRVEVTATGFAPTTLNDVPVRLGQENGLDVQVQLAGVGETVQVTSETLLLDTAQSQLSQTYTPEQVTQLPYSGARRQPRATHSRRHRAADRLRVHERRRVLLERQPHPLEQLSARRAGQQRQLGRRPRALAHEPGSSSVLPCHPRPVSTA
jgi:hypothetical protein